MWWKTESRAREREREREGKNRGVIETKKKPRILQMKRERRGMTDPSAESRDQMVSTVACMRGCLSVQHLSDFFKQLWLFLNSYRQGGRRLVGTAAAQRRAHPPVGRLENAGLLISIDPF